MSKEKSDSGGLQKSLKLIFVYTVATGSIFTFVSYWDSVFFGYCGSGTWLAFALMTIAILPTALIYSEIAPLFKTTGGELIYNTVGLNKHFGFLASWLIMAAWISVPPAVVMAIATWISRTLSLHMTFTTTMLVAVGILLFVFVMSLQDVEVLTKAQALCLFVNMTSTIITGLLILFSGHWSIHNIINGLFQTTLSPTLGIPGWIIGMALLITPYFGFETVPQMVEEGDFPIKDTKRAICGSVLTCGLIYVFFYFCVAGLDSFSNLYKGDAANGFMTIINMKRVLGWTVWPVMYGFFSVFMGLGASIMGFWMSTVRMMYAMAEKNFLPEFFMKLNKHHQPIIPNCFLLAISLIFILLMNATTFMNDFFNLMSFGCACAYALTMISVFRIHKKYPKWKSPNALKNSGLISLLAMIIMIIIAFFCTLGQGIGSWISFGVYLGFGVLLWLYMNIVRWKHSKVKIETPDGLKEY